MRRRIIVYIATSADGFIARPDGDVGWLDRPPVPGSYGMAAFLRSIDTILWGRKTYEQGLDLGGSPEGFGKGIRNHVFTRRPAPPAAKGVEFVNEPVRTFARRLRRRKGKDIWMMGGGEIIASFLDEGQIDEFVIHVIPTLIGEGIPLVAPRNRNIPLELRSTKRYRDGVVRLHYEVGKRRRSSGAQPISNFE